MNLLDVRSHTLCLKSVLIINVIRYWPKPAAWSRGMGAVVGEAQRFSVQLSEKIHLALFSVLTSHEAVSLRSGYQCLIERKRNMFSEKWSDEFTAVKRIKWGPSSVITSGYAAVGGAGAGGCRGQRGPRSPIRGNMGGVPAQSPACGASGGERPLGAAPQAGQGSAAKGPPLPVPPADVTLSPPLGSGSKGLLHHHQCLSCRLCSCFRRQNLTDYNPAGLCNRWG